MLKKSEKNSKIGFSNTTNRLNSIIWFLTITLMALILSAPIHATDPIDVDPDPDYAPITQIVVEDIDQIDLQNLPPGHYLIVVIPGDGLSDTYEIFVPY